MDDWDCPHCNASYDAGKYPDHWNDGGNRFTFECKCGAEFEVEVDWSPQFHVIKASLRLPEPEVE